MTSPDQLALALATLCFFPPGHTLTGERGRVLVCSNLHWLADADYWNGGTFKKADSARLLLNFLAGAVASRTGPLTPPIRA